MKRILPFAILLSLLLSSAFGEQLIPPVWQKNISILDEQDGARFVVLSRKLGEIATQFQNKDTTVTKTAIESLVECEILASRHKFADDPRGAELIHRVKFWLQFFSGRFGDAVATADLLIENSGEKYILWRAIAQESAAKPILLSPQEILRAPEASLGCACFLRDLGQFERALAIGTDLWLTSRAEGAIRIESAMLCAESAIALGKERRARKFLYNTAIEMRRQNRVPFIERVLKLDLVSNNKMERSLWTMLIDNPELNDAKAALAEHIAASQFDEAALLSLALFNVAPALAPSASEVINRLASWGKKELLDEFARISEKEDEHYPALALAFLHFSDMKNATYHLSICANASSDGAPRLCMAFLEQCRAKGVELQSFLAGLRLPVVAKAYFALELGDTDSLETAIDQLRVEQPHNPILVLAPLAAAIKRGEGITVPLDVLDGVCTKSEISSDWLLNFRYDAVVRKSIEFTQSDADILVQMIDRAVKRICPNDNSEIERALMFNALCGNDARLLSKAAEKLIAIVEKAETKDLPNWYAALLHDRLNALFDAETDISKAISIATKVFSKDGNLLFLHGCVNMRDNRPEEALKMLREAFIYGSPSVRERAELLIREIENSNGGKK